MSRCSGCVLKWLGRIPLRKIVGELGCVIIVDRVCGLFVCSLIVRAVWVLGFGVILIHGYVCSTFARSIARRRVFIFLGPRGCPVRSRWFVLV